MLLINPKVLNQLHYTHVIKFYDGKLIKSLPLSEVPMIDAEPIKYGRWLYVCNAAVKCSCCSAILATQSNYCPNCGADMREEERPLAWIPRDNWELGCEYDCPYCGAMIDVPHGGAMPHKCEKCGNEVD